METKTKTINEIEFQLTQPYAEGHVVTAAEAKALNQVRSENIGNNMRAAVKKALEEGQSTADIVALVSAYDTAYVFNQAAARQASATRLDPVEKEARKLALEYIKSDLQAKGRKITTIPEGKTKEEWDELVEAKIDELAQHPKIVEEAGKIVKAKQKRAESLASAIGEIA